MATGLTEKTKRNKMTFYIRNDETEIISAENEVELILGWSVVDDEGTVQGFHKQKVKAIRQAVAIAKAADDYYMGDWRYKERPQEKPLE